MKQKIISVLIAFLLLLPVFSTPVQAKWGADCLWSGNVRTVSKINWLFAEHKDVAINDVATLKGIECAFVRVVTTVAALAGVILFIMLLVGGFKFLTSGGDQKQVEAAKATLTQAIAGLVILISAYVIIQLISNLTGASGIETFQVTQP